MKKSIFLIGLVFALVSCKSKPTTESAGAGDAQNVAVSEGTEYSLNSASSSLNWIGSKPGGEHKGVVTVIDGVLSVEKGKVSSGTFTIDLNTITNLDLTDAEMNGKLVSHLKSPDFFDVAKFPTAKFDLVSVVEIPATDPLTTDAVQVTHQITGNLLMKGITKSISFPAKIDVTETSVSAVSRPFGIDRTQWGVNYGSKSIFAELKDKFINDEIIISLNLSFSKI